MTLQEPAASHDASDAVSTVAGDQAEPEADAEQQRIQVLAAQRAEFAAAGLPIPIYDRTTLRVTGGGGSEWDSRIGMATHRVIGLVAERALRVPAHEFGALLQPVVGSVVRGREFGRLDRARVRVTGLAVRYLREFLPSPASEFLGAEQLVGRGRADLLWRAPGAGVWFDEIKTWRHTQPTFDSDTWAQVTRYLADGTALYRRDFAGVRLLTLGSMRACVHVSPDGMIEDLDKSKLHPVRLRDPGTETQTETAGGTGGRST